MHDIAQFITQCAHSRALVTSLCALIIVPPAAALASRMFAPHIRRMTDDPAWQAAYAAAAAGLPGAIFLVLAVGSLVSGSGTACWTMPGGRFVFGAIALLTVAAIIRACWLFIAQKDDVRALVRSSGPPAWRLRKLAATCGVRVREIYDATPVCVLAGLRTPIVLVSTGALRVLDDEELYAALLHERAHIRRGDQVVGACLAFLAELLPLPSADLLETYQLARELAADSAAAKVAGGDALARALIAFAKGSLAVTGAVSFAEPRRRSVITRVATLLAERRLRRGEAFAHIARRFTLGFALAVVAVIGVSFPVVAAEQPAQCPIEVRSIT